MKPSELYFDRVMRNNQNGYDVIDNAHEGKFL